MNFNLFFIIVNNNFKSRPERLKFIHLLYFSLSGLDLKFCSVWSLGHVMKVVYGCIHLIQNRLSSELLHCALRIVAYPDRNAPWM